ncbi:single-stranded DNA-binding protein [Chitinimonas koreensis]|uniref:single-stranded DNA-binding protein n=1 Tax=Chitinimonas koreensis TaxID=356302 RepID=UPI0004223712|nr:single-stranded DNA-binding protein [Chitinimonas koreensis]QNM95478.1 single-stranded DNA-binding protein [Chitinimonas koreensis]
MSNIFFGTGNIGKAPELRYVPVNGESRAVLNFSVYCDDYKRTAGGELEQTDKGFWVRVGFWGPRAERAAKLLEKGSRVRVEGNLVQDRWQDENGAEQRGLTLEADDVFISMSRIESITWKPRADRPDNTDTSNG